jgi:phosphatidylglycerol---prolipoprotein diacylglyceryl transferase
MMIPSFMRTPNSEDKNMHPTLYQFSESAGIHSYGLMILLALLSAFVISSKRAGTIGIDTDELPGMYLLVAIAGILGARLFYFLFSDTADFFSNPMIFFDGSEGGLVFYGGAIGGVITGVIYCYLKKIPVWKMSDIGGPAIMLGLAVGRIGCFFAGCCHGAACDAQVSSTLLAMQGGSLVVVDAAPHLALVFNSGVGVGAIHGVPTYPTQMWEFTGAVSLFLALSWVWKKLRYFDGQIIAMTMVVYAGLRSSIENFRGDTIRGENIVSSLSTSQTISVIMVVLAAVIFVIQFRKGLAPEKEFVPEDDSEYDE